jgi:hypothetical protein
MRILRREINDEATAGQQEDAGQRSFIKDHSASAVSGACSQNSGCVGGIDSCWGLQDRPVGNAASEGGPRGA